MDVAGDQSGESAARTAEAQALWHELVLPPSQAGMRPIDPAVTLGHGPAGGARPRMPAFDAVAIPALLDPAEGDAPAPAPPAAAAAPGAASGPGAPAAAMSDRELEELLGRLYPRLRHRLTGELLVSRERAGQLVDLR